MGTTSIFNPPHPGGLFRERPRPDRRLFGLPAAGHDRGLALVYSAALGGWSYLVAWGVLHALDVSDAQKAGGAIGTASGVLVLLQFLRIDGSPSKHGHTESTPPSPLPS